MAGATERLGVADVTKFFARVGWFFREQHVHDWGIDGHVEIVRDGRPTGELIALQIKSGKSFFAEEDEKTVTFRPDVKSVEYWLKHSMPVVVVLYNPDTDKSYWEHISKEIVESTGKGLKMIVPKSQSFEDAKRTCHLLSQLVQPEPYIRRLNKLRLDKPWMERLQNGETVKVTFDDWVNKSLPRYELELHADDDQVSFPLSYMPGIDVEAMLELLLPWAKFSLDAEAHREGAEGQWQADCYSYHDRETGETYYSQPFDSWYERPTEVMMPVSSDGEVESYSLILSLNDLGKAFLVADEFLSVPPEDEPRTFSLDEVIGG